MKLLILLLIISTSVLADLPTNPRFTWVNPTQNTDGSPLVDQTSTNIECTGLATSPIVVPFPATEYTSTIGEFPDGNYDCSLRAVNAGGQASAPTPLVRFTVQAVPTLTIPMPPLNGLVN